MFDDSLCFELVFDQELLLLEYGFYVFSLSVDILYFFTELCVGLI